MSGNETGGKTEAPAYFTAPDTHVLFKPRLLFAVHGLLLIWFCLTHYTMQGLVLTAIALTGMAVSCCFFFPKEQIPANAVKYKAGHFLFWTVLCIAGIFFCTALSENVRQLPSLLNVLKTVPFYLKLAGAAGLIFLSEKLKTRFPEKIVHFLCAAMLLWAFAGALKPDVGLLLLAGGLTLLFFFADMWMLAENAAVTDCKVHCPAYGPVQLLFCGIPALYVFARSSADWTAKPAEKLAPLLSPLPFFCLLGVVLGMAVICTAFGTERSPANNETAFFSTAFFTLILAKLVYVLPFRFAPVIPAVYVLLSLPFILSAGPDTVLSKFSDRIGLSVFVLHMIVSGLALLTYLLLRDGMYLCTAAVLISAYLLITGSALAKLNASRFRWHAYLALVYPLFLALCTDLGTLRLLPAVIHGILMLLLQAAGAVWEMQTAAEKQVGEHCTGTTKELFLKHLSDGRLQKLLSCGKTVILGGYIILTAFLLRELL